jgi:Na+-driven multidrug efflux pump
MAAPLVVSFWMRAAFTFVDTIYAATLGDAAVAALGLTVPFEFLAIAVWVGLSTGLTSALSRAMGARQGEKIQQYLRASRRLVLAVAPAFMVLGAVIWFAAPRGGLDDAVYRAFRIYGTTLIGGGALTFFWSIIPDSLVKAHQDTRTTMWAGIASNFLNVGLNTLFLFVFHWGVFGIALSTVLGRIGGLVYAQVKARAHERRRLASFRAETRELDPAPYRAILSLAIPSSLTFALMASETAIINSLLAAAEKATEAIAAYSIFHRVALFALNPIIAASVALLPYAARRFGESDLGGIRRALRHTYVASLAYALLVAVPAIALAAEPVARWLTESDLTTRYATALLWLVPAACLLGAPFLLCRPIFEGMQRGRPGLVMALVRYLVLTPPTAWLGMRLALYAGFPALYGLVSATLVVAAVTSAAFHFWLRSTLAKA